MIHHSYSKLEFIFDRKEEWKARIKMIRNAKKFLYSSSFFLHYDKYGKEYVEELIKANLRGVDITLVLDSFGQMLCSNLMTKEEQYDVKDAFIRMENLGIKLIFCKPEKLLQKCLGSGMHIKIQVSDAGGALFFSGNISGTAYEKWQEMSAYVEGDIAYYLLHEFYTLGVKKIPFDHEYPLIEKAMKKKRKGTIGYISYDPVADPHVLNPMMLSKPNENTDYLEKEIDKAVSRICLSSVFFKPCPQLMAALERASKRGVNVEVFHSGLNVFNGAITIPYTPCYMRYKKCLKAGITIWENDEGEHTKMVLIDNRKVIFGSYNFEWAAHDRISEAMMESTDKEHIHIIREKFREMRRNPKNKIVTEEIFNTVPLKVKIQAILIKFIHRWF